MDEDQTSEDVKKTDEEAAGGGDTIKAPEGFVSKEQFAASQTEAIRLKKENEDLKKASTGANGLPLEEKRVREILSKYEQEKLDATKKDDEFIKGEFDKLHTIHGTFDDKKLAAIIERYGVYGADGKPQFEKAMELYQRLGGVAEPLKKAAGGRTSDKIVEDDKPIEVSKKSMHELIEEAKQKHGGMYNIN